MSGDILSDDEIRALHQLLLDEDIRSIQGPDTRECRIALKLVFGTTPRREQEARARCAEILNARKAG